MTDGDAKRDDAQNGLDGKGDRLPCDDDRVSSRQIGLVRPSHGRKRTVQNQERGACKKHEVYDLQIQRFPEDRAISKRLEPEKVNPIRQSDSSADEDAQSQSNQEKDPATPPC